MRYQKAGPESSSAPSDDERRAEAYFPQDRLREVVDMLEQSYSFEESKKIRQFLRRDRAALATLVKALPRIEEIFDFSDILVSLEESAPGSSYSKELYIRIFTSFEVDEALEQLDAFDQEWWLAQPAEIHNRICFDVDFR
jgi:hypothetical protein